MAAILSSTPTPTPSYLDILSASTSALLSQNTSLDTPAIATDVASLSGLTVEHDATVSGHLHISGSSLIEGVLNVIHTMTTNNFVSTGWSDFMGSVIFRGGVSFTQAPTFNKDTAGTAVIKKGTDSITIKFTKAYEDVPVINATISLSTPADDKKNNDTIEKLILSGDVRYLILNRDTKGFTIKLNKKAVDDIEFSWMAIAVKEQPAVPGISSMPISTPVMSVSSIHTTSTSSSKLSSME